MTGHICPLCQTAKHMRRTKLLYGTPVCKRCYYRFASRRQLAYIVDAMIWWPTTFVLGFGLALVFESASLDPGISAFLSFGFGWVVFPMIFICKDSFSGHSPGKWVCGVRVVDRDRAEPIGIASSFKRNLPLMIPLMPLVVAFLLQKGHRLGDGWAKSKVVWKRYANHPVFTGLFACQRCQFDLTETRRAFARNAARRFRKLPVGLQFVPSPRCREPRVSDQLSAAPSRPAHRAVSDRTVDSA